MSAFFVTKKIPAIHVYRNHLDELHNLLESFCKEKKQYSWSLIDKKAIYGQDAVESYLFKNFPKELIYAVTSTDGKRQLRIYISNGIVINLSNGEHSLYGLFTEVCSTLDKLKLPRFLVSLRRHWLFSILLAAWVVPVILFILFHQNNWAAGWGILFPMLPLAIIFNVFISESPSHMEWGDIILKTKIDYYAYNAKLGVPFYSILTSTKTMISFLAAVATIVSTVILFINH